MITFIYIYHFIRHQLTENRFIQQKEKLSKKYSYIHTVHGLNYVNEF